MFVHFVTYATLQYVFEYIPLITLQALIGQHSQQSGGMDGGGGSSGSSGGQSQVETLTTLLHQAQQLQQLQALQQQVVVSNGNPPPPPPPAAMSNQSLHSTGDQPVFNKVCNITIDYWGLPEFTSHIQIFCTLRLSLGSCNLW